MGRRENLNFIGYRVVSSRLEINIGNFLTPIFSNSVRIFLFFATFVMTGKPAFAQVGESILLPPVVPPGFDRGHNQSVQELPRPAFNPVGIRIGSFNLLPSITTGSGGTTNTYYTSNSTPSTFISNTPTAEIISQWSRHQLMLSGTGTFREYLGQPRRNETTWQVDERGRIDLGRFSSITAEETSSQLTENQFSGEIVPTVAALSRYRRDFFSLRAVNQINRLRLTFATDYSIFRFQPLPLLTGETRNQTNRNRNIARVTGQFEYARSPSAAFFLQASYATQSFETVLAPGVPNVDSRAYRLLAGVNFDDSGFARGSLALGYTRQTYMASIYRPVGGLSLQGHVDLFPTRLTTVTFDVGRTIEITSLNVGASAYWSNRVNGRVDHEIRRDLIANIRASYTRQKYINSGLSSNAYQATIGARYLSSRKVVVDLSLDYGNRSANANILGSGFDELRGEVGFTFRI